MNPLPHAIGEFSAPLVQGMVNLLLQSTLVILAGLIAAHWFRKYGSAVQSAIFRGTLVAVFCCPVASLALNEMGVVGWTIRLPELTAVSESPEALSIPSSILSPPVSATLSNLSDSSSNETKGIVETAGSFGSRSLPPNDDAGSMDGGQFRDPVFADPAINPHNKASNQDLSLSFPSASVYPLIVIVWVLGAIWLLARLAIAYVRLQSWRRQSVGAEEQDIAICRELAERIRLTTPQVLRNPQLSSPCLTGILQPAILLPLEIQDRVRLGQAFAHELAHLHRRDNLWNLAQRLGLSLFFFQPLIWWLVKRLETTAEEVCDDCVVSLCADRAGYAQQLVELAESSNGQLGLAGIGMFQYRSVLGQRIVRILDSTRQLTTSVNRNAVHFISMAAIGSAVLVGSIGSGSIATLSLDKAAETISLDEDEWIRGSGENLELRIQGRVFDSSGKAEDDFQVSLGTHSRYGREEVQTATEGNHFIAWIPVNWEITGIRIECKSTDGRRLAVLSLGNHKVRQAAMEGVSLQLKEATRKVEVRTIFAGEPVPKAMVKLQASGFDLSAKSDEDGIARFHLMPEEQLYAFTAWTESGLIGGFQFARGPTRDATQDRHEVELFKCRPLTIRLLNTADNSPVVGAKFRIEVATPPPHFNYIGSNDHFTMTSDSRGEARFESLPDWPSHHAYIENLDPNWAIDDEEFKIVDDVMTVHMKKSALPNRKLATGKLALPENSPGGFAVRLRSFNGEQPGTSESISVFADEEGNFTANVLPDVVYAIVVEDSQWVSKFDSAILFDSTSGKGEIPKLKVEPGIPVTVRATVGSSDLPLANQAISLISEYSYRFTEDGKSRNGTTHRHVFATTDSNGNASFVAPPGPLRATMFVGAWRDEIEGEAIEGQATLLKFHKPTADKVLTTIGFSVPDGQPSSLADLPVFIRSLDEHGREALDLKTNDKGQVTFSSDSGSVAVYAKTSDGEFCIVQAIDIGSSQVDLLMRPALKFSGRLITSTGQPGRDYLVMIRGSSPNRGQTVVRDLFSEIVETDANGRFVFQGVPAESVCYLAAAPKSSPNEQDGITQFYLEPNESRAEEEYIVGPASQPTSPTAQLSIAQRYEIKLRDARLGGFNLLAIGYIHDDKTAELVQDKLLDYDVVPECSRFLDFLIPMKADSAKGKEYFDSRGWPVPEQGQVFICAMDQTGTELERVTIDPTEASTQEKMQAFMKRHAPPQADAQVKWEQALAEAARSNRKVFARISQRYCGPCFLLSRWIDDHRELLEKDYVIVKIDNVLDANGGKFWEMMMEGRMVGVPFFVIYDSEGQKLVDACGPLGNIGFPSSYEGKKHLRKMLDQTKTTLTDEEIDGLMGSLK